MKNQRFISEHRYEPVVYYCNIDKDLVPGTRFGPVRRDVFLFECCSQGYGGIIINGKQFDITPRCAYFLFPGDDVTHLTDSKFPREGYFCAVSGLQIESELKRAKITSESPFAPPEVFDEIYLHLKELYDTRDEADYGADLRRTAHIYNILGALLRTGAAVDKNTWIQKAIGYMERNYYNPISVSEIASAIGLDRSYFSTLFKEQTGMSPHSYLTGMRIKKAEAMIKEGENTMARIAEAVGLDPQNFTRLFLREVGMTPLQYKRREK